MAVIEPKLLARNVSGEYIGVITLNKEKSLNALNLEMVQLMTKYLNEWRNDQSVVAIFIEGAGGKAFCAGGDVVSMYQAMKNVREEQNLKANEKLESPPEFLSDFFTQEYALDYCIHTYPKPIVTWGSGIVMGGGLGLFAASQFAIATETSKIAMPEISIGLFPDVGGSYFLNKMPSGIGLFLGLTGASFNGIDAFDVELASHKLSSLSKQTLLSTLVSMDVVSETTVDKALSELQTIDAVSFASVEPRLSPNFNLLSSLGTANSLREAVSVVSKIVEEKAGDKWWSRALSTLENGSPITANLVFEQLSRSHSLSLADCFRQELSMALSCSMYGEFEEGVRALLIDKDLAPQWLYKSRNEVPVEVIESHFTYLDVAKVGITKNNDNSDIVHPLHHLEETYGVKHV
ncbi:enoyl-CoA hydratase/isomerase family protein [Glaciecola sp. MF2-115]|uniref:enoyl-CoA hydratase/isomerase family protein n=1 Tax=Glaciecola sp. MF2-115 TaxID=3384827 RepID=UPI00399F9807